MRHRLSDYDFALPPDLIAQAPASTRSASRLLHVAGATLTDLTFANLPELLRSGDLLVFNDTRVIKARVQGRKSSGGRVELLVERILGPAEALVQLRASHPPRPGSSIDLPGDISAQVIARDDRFFRLGFHGVASLVDWLDTWGEVPLPPYIARPAGREDATRYQTVYAREPGAVAAPTAGLHFDTATFTALDARGVQRAFITLHVGAGTFQPVATEDIAEHRMHAEWYRIPRAAADAIAAAHERRSAVVAVGTTSARALESALDCDGRVHAREAETSLFVTPGYRFRAVDRLLTNFHLPRSTLLMLVSAFAGYENIRRAYAHAIAQRYRFFSYGDAMLLERADSVSGEP